MKTAALIGIPLSEFNKMTPKEFFIYVDGFNRRKELDNEENKVMFELGQKALIYQAYLISRWVWQKKVDIEKILKSENKNEAMTDEQMLSQVKVLNTIFGGDIVEK